MNVLLGQANAGVPGKPHDRECIGTRQPEASQIRVTQRWLFNVWGIQFDPAKGRAIGEPFRVTEFEKPSLKVPETIVLVAFSINEDKIVLTMEEVSGSIWVMDNVDQ